MRSWRIVAGLSVVLIVGCQGQREPEVATRTEEPTIAEASVNPGVNEAYEDPDVVEWQRRFERESREVYAEQDRIIAAMDLAAGDAVADIGAGTGFYALKFAEAVGPQGQVYAVDIVPEFLQLIEKRAAERGVENIEVVRGAEKSVSLPPNSVDAAFICDTYHHFEYPLSTMRSLYFAMKPGGRVYVIDFIREEGQSSAWVMEHVRAGAETFAEEIRAVGFERVAGPATPYLEENYLMVFRKPR